MKQPARKMKPSGIPWIGDVPADWDVVRLKNVFFSVEAGLWGENPGGDVRDRICLRIADFDFHRRRFKHGTEYTIRSYSKYDSERLSLKYGDIVLEKSGGGEKTPVGRTVIFDLDLKNPLFANFSVRLRVRFENDPWFVHFFLLLLYFQQVNLLYINQTTGIQNLNVSKLLSTEKILLPPAGTQKRIAEFLDKKCAEIDALIAVEEKMITELKDYKQSVITEAVTRGVPAKNSVASRSRGKIPTKDTGIPWLGSIPAHWEIRPLKTCATINDDVLSENTSGDFVIKYIDIGSVSLVAGISRFEEMTFSESPSRARRKVKNGDVIISTVRTYLRAIAEIKNPEENWICSTGFTVVRARKNLLSGFMKYVLTSEYFVGDVIRYSNGLNYPTINTPELGSIRIFVPPQNEQRIISEYLDRKCAEIDSLVSVKQEKIITLQNYKKSVIFEYVTGKNPYL